MKKLFFLLFIPVFILFYLCYSVVNAAAVVINTVGTEFPNKIDIVEILTIPDVPVSDATIIPVSASDAVYSSETVPSPGEVNSSYSIVPSPGETYSPSDTIISPGEVNSSYSIVPSPGETYSPSGTASSPGKVTSSSATVPSPGGVSSSYSGIPSEGSIPLTASSASSSSYIANGDEWSDGSMATITLSFVGDCTIGDDEAYHWNTFNEVYERVNDPSYFFNGVKSVLGSDDFTFANLEGTFTTAEGKAEKEYRFKGDPSYCDVLVQGSIEGVTLANNHTLDYLEIGFEDTVKTLDNAGISYTWFETSFIQEIKGLKIGFLGYKGWEHEKKSNALLEKQVQEMREQGVDYIVANYHWGSEKHYQPNKLQKRMARFAIDHGVDLVIGHHPHVIQGMEVYNGKNIVYSLGNFCFGGAPNPSDKDTIIYQHIITFDPSTKTISAVDHKIIPCRVSSVSRKNDYQPVIATGEEEQQIMKKFSNLSEEITADDGF